MTKQRPPTLPGTTHVGDESHLFRDLFRTHQAVATAFHRGVGAPSSRMGLLRLVVVAQGELGTNELARRMGVDAAVVTRQLKELEAEGLVARRAHATDGRRTTVKLTAAGRRAFRELHDRGHAYERALAAEVSPRDIEATRRVLEAMRRVVLRSVNMQEEDVP